MIDGSEKLNDAQLKAIDKLEHDEPEGKLEALYFYATSVKAVFRFSEGLQEVTISSTGEIEEF